MNTGTHFLLVYHMFKLCHTEESAATYLQLGSKVHVNKQFLTMHFIAMKKVVDKLVDHRLQHTITS